MSPASLHAAAEEIDAYLKRLFPICRSITGNGNRETLSILRDIVPLTIHEVPSGKQVYDWVIPDEWNIRDAWIEGPNGERLVDFRENNLHAVSYSQPVDAELDWGDLHPHLHTHPELPEAIPYRTSYYNRDWGFCLTRKQYDELKRMGGPYRVLIDSELKPGSLSYGELLVPGLSKLETLISCYICHPSMANDSLSGVILTAFLVRYLLSLKNRRFSYRIAFVPETIGAIAYCAENESALKLIDMGLVITTVGGPGRFGYKQSYDSRHPINRLIEEVFGEAGVDDFITYPFDIHGSDERQYSSQGFGINMATISRDRYYEYPEYHTSLDNLDLVTGGQIAETLTLYARLINKLEARKIYKSAINHCEVMLSKHDLYPKNGGAQRPELGGRTELDLILWLLFLCDGKLSLQDIGHRLSVPSGQLTSMVERLESAGILEHV